MDLWTGLLPIELMEQLWSLNAPLRSDMESGFIDPTDCVLNTSRLQDVFETFSFVLKDRNLCGGER